MLTGCESYKLLRLGKTLKPLNRKIGILRVDFPIMSVIQRRIYYLQGVLFSNTAARRTRIEKSRDDLSTNVKSSLGRIPRLNFLTPNRILSELIDGIERIVIEFPT